MKMLSFTQGLIVPNLYDFVFYFMWNIKEDILKNVGVQTVSVFCKKNTMEVNRNRSCLVTNILQNILYCLPKKKERFRRT